MGVNFVKSGVAGGRRTTRRELVAATAAASLGLLVGARPALGWSDPDDAAGQDDGGAADRGDRMPTPWWIERYPELSRVVEVRSARVLNASVVEPGRLGEMLDRGIQHLTGSANPLTGWQAVLGAAERIVLKFNAVGAGTIRTTEPMARVLVSRLAAAGYEAGRVALVEAPAKLTKELGARTAAPGWGTSVPLAGTAEELANYLLEADALINVPFLKTHQIAGMSGCLKNISHAVIRHPARYHANGCSPFVGQVVGSSPVSSRLKLNIVNALRVVVDGGPDAREADIVGYGGLLLGFDPVAVDNVGLSILATERRRLGLNGGGEIRYLVAAARAGLGRWRPVDIDRVAVEVEG